MVLKVIDAPCSDVGHNYDIVSGVDHLGFKLGHATTYDCTQQYLGHLCCTTGPSW